MTTENKILDLSFEADEDLTNDQYRFVVLTSAGKVRRNDSETEVAIGVLQNAPDAGEAAVVRVSGTTKLQANDALGIGTFVMPEYVSATDAGKAKTSVGAPAYTRALVVAASGAEDDLCSALLTSVFPAVNDAVASITTVLTDATAGAKTYTAANLIGGLILRDPAGDNRSDVTPTAVAIIAGIAGAVLGSSFQFTVRNTADAAETITLTAGVGVTLSGTMTIAQNNSKRFLCVVDGAATVTIYSMGTFVH